MEIKSNARTSFFLAIILIVFTASLFRCKRDRSKPIPSGNSEEHNTTINSKIISSTFNGIEKINFYFENSGSMNGYLDGTNFQQTMHEVIDKNDERINPFFVNTEEYPTTNILSKIDKKNIATKGIGGSDHEFIFTNAINNATGDNLSIVITDGIYSTPNGNVAVVEVDIKKAFVEALEENAIETVVLKLTSHYKGMYYTESECAHVKINQERPYYILLFGSKETIDDALKNLVIIEDLPGFKEQSRLFLTDNLKVDYTILTIGEEKKGSFRKFGRSGNGLVKEIEDVERYDRNGEKYLQFGIAMDYSNISIPDSYLEDKDNYKVEGGTGYVIEEIKPISDISKKGKTYDAIQSIDEKEKTNFTHITTVKAEFDATGELIIKLENNLPSWIKETGLENDCGIKDNISQTYAFDNLMTGISKAYIRVNKNKEYLD